MESEYVFGRQAARLLGVSITRIAAIAEAGGVRRLRYPGSSWVRYHKGDLLDLRAASIVGQGREKAVSA